MIGQEKAHKKSRKKKIPVKLKDIKPFFANWKDFF